jgi:deazaflavin-dependent oxidoreductase (nitroreductase family)
MKPSNAIIPPTYNEQRGWDVAVMNEYRAHDGQLGGLSPQLEGSPIFILTTTGRKSGNEYSAPLCYVEDDDRVVVLASRGGTDSHPAWYYNILADPDVTIEKYGETYRARAEVIDDGAERDRLYALLVAAIPMLGEYSKMTSRTIPIVAFARTSTTG